MSLVNPTIFPELIELMFERLSKKETINNLKECKKFYCKEYHQYHKTHN